MAAVRFILGIICFIVIGSSCLFNSDLLKAVRVQQRELGGVFPGTVISKDIIPKKVVLKDLISNGVIQKAVYSLDVISKKILSTSVISKGVVSKDIILKGTIQKAVYSKDIILKKILSKDLIKKDLIQIARGELWVREKTGRNDGARVEEYLASVGLHKGDPYCAAFVSWVFKQAGHAAPRTGWSPALFPKSRLVKNVAPGYVIGIYFPLLKRIAHCGFVENTRNDWVSTIEANTNVSGGREGDGVYRRLRHRKVSALFADWNKGSK